MSRQTVLVLTGVASTTAGLVLLGTPASAPAAVPVLPVVGLLGVAALAVGGLAALDRFGDGVGTGDPSSSSATVAVPGDDFDDRLADLSVTDDAGREAVRDRLTAAAAVALAAENGCSRSAARERIDAGEWPDGRDNARVRAFFAGRDPTPAERVTTVLTGEPTIARRARRTATVLAERGDDQ
ncbi:DUF7269 family protein [Halobacterium jilantaiense]|uniref:Uncharacterized protein n=1 Tax=Halobacterium jilantaiense TaxID=355548 RepID=A0A1I0QI78_9EURY|nr:hypothetical protein [Halobacterium jilantaiense]SEW26693.1 hypothetical protein SAMN04487945_2630 [Halobacterium jilantaiense]